MEKGAKAKIIIGVIIVLIIVALIFFIFIYSHRVNSTAEFLENFESCRRIKYIEDGWKYKVKGNWIGDCKVKVTAINPASVDLETAKLLKGKTMICRFPRAVAGTVMPNQAIEYCSGELKEAIQDMMIKKMHLYIIENMGSLSSEMTQPF
jgi:hypothetical protein